MWRGFDSYMVRQSAGVISMEPMSITWVDRMRGSSEEHRGLLLQIIPEAMYYLGPKYRGAVVVDKDTRKFSVVSIDDIIWNK